MNFNCTTCAKTFSTIRGLKTHITRSHTIKPISTQPIIVQPIVQEQQQDEIFNEQDLLEMLNDYDVQPTKTTIINQSQVWITQNDDESQLPQQSIQSTTFETIQDQCKKILNDMIDKIVEEHERIKPIWYDKINIHYHVLAQELWIQYNCKTCVDLFDAFVLYIQDMAKQQQSYKLMPFTQSYQDVRKQLTLVERSKYDNLNRFILTLNGFVELDDLKHQRVQAIAILLKLGFGNLCESEQVQQSGIVNHDLDMCLRSARLNDDDRIIFGVDRMSYNKKAIYRSVELWKLQDAVREMKDNNNIQFNQILTSKISQNIKFFMDVDIKDKMKDVRSVSARELFIENLEHQTRTVLVMYGVKKQDIEFEIVAKNMLKSFHLYSNVVVKLEDCRQIIALISTQMNALGYDRESLSNVLDCGPYANENKKAQLRFPGSQKLEESVDENGEVLIISSNKKVTGLSGDFNRFLFQPKDIRNTVVTSSFHFQKINPWVNRYVDKIVEEESDADEQEQDAKFRADYDKQYSIMCEEYTEEKKKLQRTDRIALQREFMKRTRELRDNLYARYHNQKQSVKPTSDDQSFQNWLSSIQEGQIDKNGSRLKYNGECPICCKIHKSTGNRVLFIKKTEEMTVVSCVRSNSGQTLRFNNSQLIKQDKTDLSCWQLQDEFRPTMNQQYVKFDALASHVSYIQSPCGTGKTTQVVLNIQEFEKINNRSASVLFVSVRVSFSHSMVAYMLDKYKMKFDLYDDKTIEDITQCEKLMIQIESLPRLTKKTSQIRQYDFIIIDECQSVIKQINNPVCKQIDVLYGLRHLAVNAKHVIILDAFLNRISKRFIQSLMLCRSEQTIVNNFKPYENKPCEFLQFESSKQASQQYLAKTIKTLNDGNCVFSFHDERKKMLTVYDALIQEIKNGNLNIKEDEILILHGDNLLKSEDDDDQVIKTHIKKKKTIYKQGSDRLDRYKLIMFTKTLTVGIDCQLEKFTHGIHLLDFCIYSQPFEVVQAIHRFRQVKSQTMLYCDQKQKQTDIYQSAITPFDQIIRYCSGSRGISQDYAQITQDDVCLEFQTLCEITQSYQNRYGMKLISGFMNYLGYHQIHTKAQADIENKYDLTRQNRQLQFVELDGDSLELCEYIRLNGTNNMPDACETLQMHELYNVFMKTRQYLLNFYPYYQITNQMILDNQERAFNVTINDSQLNLAQICANQQFIRYDSQTTLIDSNVIHKDLQSYVNTLLDGYKPKTNPVNVLESAKTQAKLLFLGLARIDEKSYYENHKKVNESLEYLLEHKDDHKQLMQSCINHSLPKGFNNEFISGKLIAEMIKSCGLQVTTKQVRVNNVRSYILKARVNVLPAPIVV